MTLRRNSTGLICQHTFVWRSSRFSLIGLFKNEAKIIRFTSWRRNGKHWSINMKRFNNRSATYIMVRIILMRLIQLLDFFVHVNYMTNFLIVITVTPHRLKQIFNNPLKTSLNTKMIYQVRLNKVSNHFNTSLFEWRRSSTGDGAIYGWLCHILIYTALSRQNYFCMIYLKIIYSFAKVSVCKHI